MNKTSEIKKFLSNNSEENIIDYSNKLYESLKELNSKEEKYGLWFLILIFIYLLIGSSRMKEVNIGFITISDISTISKLLPLLLIYVFFNMFLITSYKKDLMLALNIISEKRFNQLHLDSKNKFLKTNFIIKLFFPYSFSNSISQVSANKANASQAFVGFFIVLPTIIVAFIPHLVLVLMLIDLYKKYTNDLLGWICFVLTIWGFSLLIFFIWINSKNEAE